jgi:hypothetical protein
VQFEVVPKQFKQGDVHSKHCDPLRNSPDMQDVQVFGDPVQVLQRSPQFEHLFVDVTYCPLTQLVQVVGSVTQVKQSELHCEQVDPFKYSPLLQDVQKS